MHDYGCSYVQILYPLPGAYTRNPAIIRPGASRGTDYSEGCGLVAEVNYMIRVPDKVKHDLAEPMRNLYVI